jgi:pimeloyl-ACP methyl ester carboxylesterase/DNA-binding winged helix-turn-helix (wHTH) protein
LKKSLFFALDHLHITADAGILRLALVEFSVIYGFGAYRLDAARMELWRDGEEVALEPQVFRLLLHLVENRDCVISKGELIDTVWDGKIVSDATLTTRINAARRAVGDSGKDQASIRTVSKRGYRFVAATKEGPALPDTQTKSGAPAVSALAQSVRFCTTRDGLRLAYASAGEGPVLVKAANWMNHLEFDWDSPIWRHVLRGLAAKRRLVRYDARGNGLSDWDADDISFDAYVHDLETVVDAVGLSRFPLLGISQGCSIAIAYAVRHPDRVTRLILYGGYARGAEKRGTPEAAEQSRALRTLMKAGWGRENPAFRQIFTSLFMPDGTAAQAQWFNDLQRITTSPENAVRFREVLDNIEVSDLLPELKVSTLVLHCLGDAMVPFEEGRRMAAAIPHADFVALEGKNHLILETDPGWPKFMAAIYAFLDPDKV